MGRPRGSERERALGRLEAATVNQRAGRYFNIWISYMTIPLSIRPGCCSDDYSYRGVYARGINLLIMLDNLVMLMIHWFTSQALFCSTASLTSLLGCLTGISDLPFPNQDSWCPHRGCAPFLILSTSINDARDLACLGCHHFSMWLGLGKRINGCVVPHHEHSALTGEAWVWRLCSEWIECSGTRQNWTHSQLCDSLAVALSEPHNLYDPIIFLSDGRMTACIQGGVCGMTNTM